MTTRDFAGKESLTKLSVAIVTSKAVLFKIGDALPIESIYSATRQLNQKILRLNMQEVSSVSFYQPVRFYF
jgi:hypothetical protein